jgi:hypothetical protein
MGIGKERKVSGKDGISVAFKMKKTIFLLVILIAFELHAQSQITDAREYLSDNNYSSVIEIPLTDSIINIYAREPQKRQYQDRFYIVGEIFITAEDADSGKFNSHAIGYLGSSSVSICCNQHEFVIQTRSRSEIKGSREFIYYDEQFNRFTIFISEWMFLGKLYISDEYIVCSMGNHPTYNYLIINKYTGKEQPLSELPNRLKEEYTAHVETYSNFDLYDYVLK